MRKWYAIALLSLLFAQAEAQSYLQTFRNKTAKQIANVTHLQRRDTTFYHIRIGDYDLDLSSAIEARGLTPLDFATIKAALDTSIFRENRLIFPPGVYQVDSLGIYSPITISGVGIKRIKPDDSTYYGSIIQSTDNTGLSLIKVLESGVFLHDISLEGTGSNGHGYYSRRTNNANGIIGSTLGGYGLTRVNSYLHGGSGFYIVGPDGNFFNDLEAFKNRQYGIVITSPTEAGLPNAGNTASGTTSAIFNSRTRNNSWGGILIDDQAATGLYHNEAIQDTTVGAYFKTGRARNFVIAGDFEMQRPALGDSAPPTYGMKVEDQNAFFMAQTFIGTQHALSADTMDAGSNTTTIVSDSLVNYAPDDYFAGWDVVNSTRSSGEIPVTNYDSATGTLTLASAIASQTTGDIFTLSKDQNIGLRIKNLTGGIFINNTFGSNVDTMVATVGDGGALFVNNLNFDPRDNLKNLSGTFKWLNINTTDVDSLSGGANTLLMDASNDFIIQSTDSLLFRSLAANKGIELSAQGKIALQPYSSAGVHIFGQVPDETNAEFRIYFDADTATGSSNLRYVTLFGNSSQPNTFSIQNDADSIFISLGAIMKVSGQDSSERALWFLNHSNGQVPITPSNGNVSVFARGDTLYAMDDNGAEFNLFAGVSGDITAVTAGNGIVGGGTTGAVTVSVDTSDTFHWLGTHNFVRDADTLKVDLSTQLYALDLEINNTRVWAVDTTGAMQASVINSASADPADAGFIRMGNNQSLAWEAAPSGTDVTLKVNNQEVVEASAPILGTALHASNGATGPGTLVLFEDTDNGANKTTFSAPSSISADVTFTLPSADGSGSDPIRTNGSATLAIAQGTAGSMYLSNGSATPNVTVGGTFVKVTGLTAESSPAALNATVAGDSIQVTYAGTYRVYVSGSLTGGVGDNFKVAVAINGTVDTNYQSEVTVSATSTAYNVGFMGRYTIPASGGASLWVTNTVDTDDPTFSQITFVLERE